MESLASYDLNNMVLSSGEENLSLIYMMPIYN
jgi:hypothetical protein